MSDRGGRGGYGDRGGRGGRGGYGDRGGRGGYGDRGGRGGYGDRGGRGGYGDRGGRGGYGDRGGRGGYGDRGGRGGYGDRGGRGGRGGFGDRGGQSFTKAPPKVSVEPHPRHPDVFICHQKGDLLVTKNYYPGHAVVREKLITIDSSNGPVEYREWNPFRSKIGSAIVKGTQNIGIEPGCSVLYLGAASGTTVSYVSDIVGPNGRVYAVEFSPRVARDLVGLAKTRPNIVPIVDDARYPAKYRALVPMVDVMFSDVAQPDQARIFNLNGDYFLKNNGRFLLTIKASCVDSTIPAEQVYEAQEQELTEAGFKVDERIDISEHHKGHLMLVGTFRPQ